MTKKLLLLVMVLAALPLVAVNAQVATTDLIGLASALPADDTLIYVGFRTDDALLDTLDAALQPFYPLADDLPPNFNLRLGLDFGVMESGLGTNFSDGIRPWLGDRGALGLFLPADCAADMAACNIDAAFDDLAAVLLLDLADRDGAIGALERLAERAGQTLETTTQGVYTVYTSAQADFSVGLADTYALVARNKTIDAYNLFNANVPTLDTSADLSDTLALLPNGGGYNAVTYVSQPAFVDVLTDLSAANATFPNTDAADSLNFFTLLESSIGAGLVILNGDTFTADVAVQTPVALTGTAPVNPAFAANIPAGTPFVVHGADISGVYQQALERAYAFAEGDPDTDVEDLRTGIAAGNSFLRGFLGLDADGLIGWITADYALTLNVPADATLQSNPLALTFLADASGNPEAALNVVNSLDAFVNGEFVASIVERDDADFTVASARNGDVLTVTLTSPEVPFPVELNIGLTDNVFRVSTTGIGVVGSDLAADASFAAAGAVLLPDANAVYYVDFARLGPVVDLLIQVNPADSEDLMALRPVLALLETATVSTAVDADGVTRVRATITTR